MPIKRDNFKRFTDTDEANRACLETMGLACMQVAQTTGYDEAGINVVTGNLRRSHTYKVEGKHVDIGVTADYGGHVHNGTSKLKGRPWLKNTVQKHRDEITEAGAAAWRRVMGE